jgi:chorismate lyase
VPADPVDGEPAALLARALATHRGTVTDWLEEQGGEPIDALVLSQGREPATDPTVWGGIPPVGSILRRTAFLVGRTSGTRYVYAESEIRTDRFPAEVHQRLETSNDPIGRVLAESGVAVHRQMVAHDIGIPTHDHGQGSLPGRIVLSRCYRMVVDDHTAMVIGEWFLTPSLPTAPGAVPARREQHVVPP